MSERQMLEFGLVVFGVVLALLVAGYVAGKALAQLDHRVDSVPVVREDKSAGQRLSSD